MRRLVNLTVPALSVLCALAPAALSAEEHTFALDAENTKLSFELGATGHDVHGLLFATAGELHFDTETGTASGELRLDSRLTATGNKKRDKTMHKKVLKSEEHPLIVFRAERIEGDVAVSGTSEFDVIGTVELLGAVHDLTLHTVAEIQDGEVSAKVTLEVPFVEWGLHDPSMLVLRVAKVVQVSIDARGTLDPTPIQTH